MRDILWTNNIFHNNGKRVLANKWELSRPFILLLLRLLTLTTPGVIRTALPREATTTTPFQDSITLYLLDCSCYLPRPGDLMGKSVNKSPGAREAHARQLRSPCWCPRDTVAVYDILRVCFFTLHNNHAVLFFGLWRCLHINLWRHTEVFGTLSTLLSLMSIMWIMTILPIKILRNLFTQCFLVILFLYPKVCRT